MSSYLTNLSKMFGLKQAELVVVNPNKKTNVRNNVGYRLIPRSIAHPFMSCGDYLQIQGAFTNNHVWVTLYNKFEKWVGGLYIDQSHGDNTLVVWHLR
ncbi:primary amine oxidase [Quercus suber]|uniref:Amine oxidase n=1 Tax=Quercus suber TaxID=58331 RepID=A0AAW0LQJ8_QUESU